eukprot:5906380-Lingulodinium_polyedra.AAC.1
MHLPVVSGVPLQRVGSTRTGQDSGSAFAAADPGPTEGTGGGLTGFAGVAFFDVAAADSDGS